MDLAARACRPASPGTPPLAPEVHAELLDSLRDWVVIEDHHLEKTWRFADFAGALAFLNRAGALCEDADHHADFELAWGRVTARIWTHTIDGLSEADFVLAARFDQLDGAGRS